MINIRKSLSTKLSLGVIVLAVPIFVISLGILFSQSRHMIRDKAVGRVSSVLNATMQRLYRNLMTIETATNSNCWLVERSFTPKALLDYSNRIVRLNPHIDGCSISAEPDLFPEYGVHFSAYSVRQSADSVRTVVEQPYDYFDKIWYKKPHDERSSCWIVYYDEADSLELVLEGMVASYSRPLYRPDSTLVGIISTDLSLLHLSRIVSEEKPYPNSYFMMLGEDGRYFVHPDPKRLFTQTIFSDVDPRRQVDLIALGHEMTAGRQGSMAVVIDGAPCLVCYQPVPGTNWSLALVCPDSDVLSGYHRLTYIVLFLLLVGLSIIFLLCHRAVAHSIRPLHQLLEKTQTIASGNMEVHIAQTKRADVIGRLQNSFATMLQSLSFHMGSVRYTSDQTKIRNEELARATRLAEEADRQKSAFIQSVSHQIRTPLNIIMGFSQVLGDTACCRLSDEEMKSVTDRMDHNSKHLSRMVLMLFDSSDTGLSEELRAHHHDLVSCNDIAREAISYVRQHYPNLLVNFQTDLPDTFFIQTSQLYLMRSLREVLYNAAKYSDGQHILFHVSSTPTDARFVVQDTGPGIAEADRDLIFRFFIKVDDLSEGLGLGLPLAKRHACNLGGDLILDTDYHDGCRFIITIPLSSK